MDDGMSFRRRNKKANLFRTINDWKLWWAMITKVLKGYDIEEEDYNLYFYSRNNRFKTEPAIWQFFFHFIFQYIGVGLWDMGYIRINRSAGKLFGSHAKMPVLLLVVTHICLCARRLLIKHIFCHTIILFMIYDELCNRVASKNNLPFKYMRMRCRFCPLFSYRHWVLIWLNYFNLRLSLSFL